MRLRRMMATKLAATAAVAAVALSACSNGGDSDGAASAAGVGTKAPEFILPEAQGGKVSLSDYVGGRPVLLYFSMGPG